MRERKCRDRRDVDETMTTNGEWGIGGRWETEPFVLETATGNPGSDCGNGGVESDCGNGVQHGMDCAEANASEPVLHLPQHPCNDFPPAALCFALIPGCAASTGNYLRQGL